MRPIVKAAVVVAALAALGRVASWFAPQGLPQPSTHAVSSAAARSARFKSVCPPGTLPDGNACVPVPEPASPTEASFGRAAAGSLIARRPDRPESFVRYEWPVPVGEQSVHAANDDPMLNEAPAAGARLPFESRPGALHIVAAAGARVRLVSLDKQQGDAEVLFAGTFFGHSVVTLHRAGERQRSYLVAYAHLAALAPEVRERARLADGAALGAAGPLPGGGTGVHLEIRQLLDGVDPHAFEAVELMQPARSVVTDVRNVLALAR